MTCIYNNTIKLEWDENKRLINLKKHELDFADAPYVFKDSNAVSYPDKKENYGEERFLIIGALRNIIVVVVCYTYLGFVE